MLILVLYFSKPFQNLQISIKLSEFLIWLNIRYTFGWHFAKACYKHMCYIFCLDFHWRYSHASHSCAVYTVFVESWLLIIEQHKQCYTKWKTSARFICNNTGYFVSFIKTSDILSPGMSCSFSQTKQIIFFRHNRPLISGIFLVPESNWHSRLSWIWILISVRGTMLLEKWTPPLYLCEVNQDLWNSDSCHL